MVGFPLLLIPLAIYNCVAFLMPTVSFTEPLFKLTLMSGAEWPVTLSDVLLALGMVLLLLEVMKGARPGAKFLTDHLLSLHRVRRRGGRIRAVAEIRHLDLPAADAAFAGRFPVRHFAAQAAPRGRGVRRCAQPARKKGTGSRAGSRSPRRPCAQAGRCAHGGNGGRIRAARSSRAEPRPTAAPAAPPSSAPAAPSPEVASPGIQPANDAHPSPDKPSR